MNWQSYLLNVVLALLLSLISSQTIAQQSGKSIYESRCASCHKISNQDLVGPGLANVNKRREQEWLVKFIRNSQKMIQAGDKLANKLYNQYNQTIMPSHTDLSKADIVGVLDYIKKQSEGIAEEPVLTKQEAKPSGGKAPEYPQFSTLPQGEAEKDYAINPDTTNFQILFWMGAIIAVLMVLAFTLIVTKFSS
jgi:mono/diheme cytochrome c family protein